MPLIVMTERLRAIADALRRCARFDRVTFAVLDRRPGTPTYRVSAEAFAPSGS